jgi:hypothetical protein
VHRIDASARRTRREHLVCCSSLTAGAVSQACFSYATDLDRDDCFVNVMGSAAHKERFLDPMVASFSARYSAY